MNSNSTKMLRRSVVQLVLLSSIALTTGVILSLIMISRSSAVDGLIITTRYEALPYINRSCRRKRIAYSSRSTPLSMIGFIPSEEDIEKQLARAMELLEKGQAKLESAAAAAAEGSQEEEKMDKTLLDQETKRMMVTKIQKEDGLVVVDGEMMARYSEEEEWQLRPLMEVFEEDDSFQGDNNTYYGLLLASTNTTKKLAQRDEVASIRNLQTIMNRQDFQKIFDEKNYFIGEQ